MLYKAGDCVVVRGDLSVGILYGSKYCVEPMLAHKNKTMVIQMVHEANKGYSLIGDNSGTIWTDEMFVPKAAVPTNIIGAGTLQLLIDGWALQHSNGRTVYYMNGGKLYSYVDKRGELHSESQEEFNKIIQTSFIPLYNYKEFKEALNNIKEVMEHYKITLEDIKNA